MTYRESIVENRVKTFTRTVGTSKNKTKPRSGSSDINTSTDIFVGILIGNFKRNC